MDPIDNKPRETPLISATQGQTSESSPQSSGTAPVAPAQVSSGAAPAAKATKGVPLDLSQLGLHDAPVIPSGDPEVDKVLALIVGLPKEPLKRGADLLKAFESQCALSGMILGRLLVFGIIMSEFKHEKLYKSILSEDGTVLYPKWPDFSRAMGKKLGVLLGYSRLSRVCRMATLWLILRRVGLVLPTALDRLEPLLTLSVDQAVRVYNDELRAHPGEIPSKQSLQLAVDRIRAKSRRAKKRENKPAPLELLKTFQAEVAEIVIDPAVLTKIKSAWMALTEALSTLQKQSGKTVMKAEAKADAGDKESDEAAHDVETSEIEHVRFRREDAVVQVHFAKADLATKLGLKDLVQKTGYRYRPLTPFGEQTLQAWTSEFGSVAEATEGLAVLKQEMTTLMAAGQ